MISVEKLWDRLVALSKSGTSGYFTQEEFNSNLYSVQYAILSVLCDNYENNQKVSDWLVNHIESLSGTTTITGLLFATGFKTNLPTYYRGLSMEYVNSPDEYPSYKITVNSIGMSKTSAIRKPNISKGRTLWYMMNDNIQMLPKVAMGYTLIYCKKPLEAKIGFTTASDADNDYLVINPATTTNIDFPEGLFNLFVYYMLESMGIQQREQITQEYSQLGINRTIQTDLK